MRVAVALLVGQALLCAVIGWLNFGPSQAHRGKASPVDPPMAAPPFVAPLPSVPQPLSAPAETARPAPARTSAKVKASTSPAKRSPAPPPEPEFPQPVNGPSRSPSTTPRAPAAPPETPGLTTDPPLPSPRDDVQAPVKVGDKCDPEDARGRTATGTPVRCVRDDDGDLRWEIV